MIEELVAELFPRVYRQFNHVAYAPDHDDDGDVYPVIGLSLDGHVCTVTLCSQKLLLSHHVLFLDEDDWTATLPGVTILPAPPPYAPVNSCYVRHAIADSYVAAMVCARWLARDKDPEAAARYWTPPPGAPFPVLLGKQTTGRRAR